jgi:glycerol uptake facilitator protein
MEKANRIVLCWIICMNANFGPVIGEFMGTAVLVLLGDGAVAAVLLARSKAANAGWIVITTAWALAVFAGIMVAAAFGDSDGHLNPAFTVASVLMGAVLVWIFYLPHWEPTQNKADKLACFCTAPAIRSPINNFMSELIGTFILVLVATAFASKRIAPGGLAPGFGPALVGGLVWSIGLSLGAMTGYAINPARDFAPRLAHALLPIAGKGDSDWSYAPIPIFGPICGAILAALFINWSGMS